MIDLNIPVQMANGDKVRVIDYRRGEKYGIVAVHQTDGKYQVARFSLDGTPATGNPDHHIQNKPNLRCVELHMNIYDDGTGGYGYPSEELAAKYARTDCRLPVIARKKITVVVPQNPKPGQA